ncbi:TetR/AcrR family transcriptional regulator [Brevibacterium sp. UCMA 11754]|uniref:TetR/AcrR family transcriptional regulator n=1 Tax=Brevibacterium sp. UCMA 11754 TaxID=2749198 RepID=UPI001F3E3225|nr:TetR/AcrR family transcriptional regulator [Brevibacterium sp. UCMA 11754]MCF2572636.1 TetR/AcrR family transcriptional regulator [Brevibacterium sp. UCMA 11754]
MSLKSSSPSPKRSDAKRNRDKILTAARAAFAESDGTVSLAEVSRRAGVGMATLYRNFPSRLDLLEALYANEADIAFAPPESLPSSDPGAAFRTWLRQFYLFAAGKKQFAAELLTQLSRDSPIFDDTKSRVIAVGRPLFDAALSARQLREGVQLEQILEMLVALSAIAGDAEYREAMLDVVLDGLTPTPERGGSLG